MAKVATRGSLLPSSKSLQFAGGSGSGSIGVTSKGATAMKRKTPSELRGEQLKRKNIIELIDESPAPEPMKPILSKNPRYIDTRVDELFPSRKNSLRLKMLFGKENIKENITADNTDSLKNSSFSLKFTADMPPQCSGPKVSNASDSTSTKDFKSTQPYITTQKCSESTFRSVMELSTGGEKSSNFSLDMDEAFKGLAARDPPIVSASPAESFDINMNPATANFCSEFHVPGQKIPLDFTLKTSIRVASSSSVTWFHRLMNGSFEHSSTAQFPGTNTLHSWVYPQSSLPPSVISALTLSAKGEGKMDFLNKRQLAWEASFRNLYVMLRKNICNLFYVCTGQFVAMFTSGNAYVSQSTRSLRSLLKEQDICFTMPLCHSKVEQVTTEDLFELSEIEKYNVGQTKRTVSLSDVDNTPESLLAFSGNNNVHGLYDFLLNYRFLLPSLNNVDVPILYSPIPFENGAHSAPEVKCKEVRRIDQGSALMSYYSIEIKDAYLPPWIISSVCDTIKLNGDTFEANFVTEPMSIGLNLGLDNEGLPEQTNTVVSTRLSHAYLKGVKYSENSYVASLAPV